MFISFTLTSRNLATIMCRIINSEHISSKHKKTVNLIFIFILGRFFFFLTLVTKPEPDDLNQFTLG